MDERWIYKNDPEERNIQTNKNKIMDSEKLMAEYMEIQQLQNQYNTIIIIHIKDWKRQCLEKRDWV